MKKILTTLVVVLAGMLGTTGYAAIPTGYYNNAIGKSQEALMTALYNIINGHTTLSYASLLTHYANTDCDANGKIIDRYANTSYTINDNGSSASAVGEGWNREHSFPKSWFNESSPMSTDIMHIVPTDIYCNSIRGNYPFGECSGGTAYGTIKRGNCTYSGYTGIVVEPADNWKGDFARIYFYMVTCYKNKVSSWSSDQLDYSTNGYKAFSTWSINMLMEWSREDPVDEIEIARNDSVYKIQGNRNPYVDHPGLEEYIWGTKDGTAWDGTDSGTTTAVLNQPAAGSTINVGTISATGTSVSKTVTVKGTNLTQSLNVSVSGTGFSVSPATLSASNVNNGTTVTVTYSGSASSATGTLILTGNDGINRTVSLTAGKSSGGGQTGTYNFRKVTSVTAGKRYLIVAENNGTLLAMVPVNPGKNYQYPLTQTVTANGDVISLESDTLAYTFGSLSSGYFIKDSHNRYYYQSGTYKTMNATTTLSNDYAWTMTAQNDGTFTISDNGYSLQYSPNYTSYGVYSTSTGVYPCLYEEVSEEATATVTLSGNITGVDANQNESSTVKSGTVTTENNSANVTITVTGNYQISSNQSTWGTTLTLGSGGGTFYVRLASTATAGNYSGTITATAGTATDSVTVSGTVTEAAGNEDINDDGTWSMADVTTLIAYVLGNNPSPCLTENCDVNNDGGISMADVTTLIGNILGN